jgi:hypothetical protein
MTRNANTNQVSGYGVGSPSIKIAPVPLTFHRVPATTDIQYQIGQQLIYNNVIYVLTSVTAGSATWVALSNSSGSFTSLNVSGATTTNTLSVTSTASTGALGVTGDETVTSGNVIIATAGKGLQIKEGSNARMGTATLVAGTVTVANTSVTATTRILLTVQSLGTVTAPKAIAVTARSAGASFTITSADNTDTSVVAWELIEPAA